MGQIIGLDGLPLKSNEELKQEADAKEVVGKAIEKQADFHTPRSLQKAIDILNKHQYGYCVLLIHPKKTASKVLHNIKHPNANLLIQQSIHNHFSSQQS